MAERHESGLVLVARCAGAAEAAAALRVLAVLRFPLDKVVVAPNSRQLFAEPDVAEAAFLLLLQSRSLAAHPASCPHATSAGDRRSVRAVSAAGALLVLVIVMAVLGVVLGRHPAQPQRTPHPPTRRT